MKLNQPEKVINQNLSGNINDNKKNQKEEIKLDESELKQNLKKFAFLETKKSLDLLDLLKILLLLLMVIILIVIIISKLLT